MNWFSSESAFQEMDSNLDSDYSAVEHGTSKLSRNNYPKLLMIFSDPWSFALSITAGGEEFSKHDRFSLL